jgi:hypothetical protein
MSASATLAELIRARVNRNVRDYFASMLRLHVIVRAYRERQITLAELRECFK